MWECQDGLRTAIDGNQDGGLISDALVVVMTDGAGATCDSRLDALLQEYHLLHLAAAATAAAAAAAAAGGATRACLRPRLLPLPAVR